MRQIGILSSENHASIFNDYLLTRGIKAMVEAEGDEWVVWIYDEDQIVQAKEELATFLDNSDDPLYRKVAQTAKEVRRETGKLNKQLRKKVVDVRERWNRPLSSRCPVTFALITFSVLVVVLSTSTENGFWNLCTKEEPLLSYLRITKTMGAENGVQWYPNRGLQDILDGQIWRLVTPIFLHFNLMHILFNMLWLRDLGSSVEHQRGSLRFLLMVLLMAATSNLAQYGMNRLDGAGPNFGGMSGVVFGLFGYVWMKSRFDPGSGFFMPPTVVFLMVAMFFLCMTGAVGNIANTAHGVGLGVGMALGYASKLLRDMQRRA